MFWWLMKQVGGRHTFFALFFAFTAFFLAYHMLLTHVYVEVIVALQAYILVHSIKSDVADGKKVDLKKLPPPPPMDSR